MAQKQEPILIVDDEPSAVTYVATLLKKAGYEVITAESGYAAFVALEKRLAERQGAFLKGVICDWKMPGWDGLKLLSELKNSPYQKVPFILMSGAVTREELVTAAANKANGVLLKPVDRELLLKRVAEIFGPAS